MLVFSLFIETLNTEDIFFESSFKETRCSMSVKLPVFITKLFNLRLVISVEMYSKASFQVTCTKMLFFFIIGFTKRSLLKLSKAYLDLSDIHSSLITSLFTGKIRMISEFLTSNLMLLHKESNKSIVSILLSSHDRALNA
jgi:hypothetical protein